METPPSPMIDVLEGVDEYLFLAGGNHGVQALFTGQKGASTSSVKTFWANVAQRKKFADRYNLGLRTCIFPEKFVALPSLTGLDVEISSVYERYYRDAAPELESTYNVTYPIDALYNRAERLSKTDTHYSGLGCLALVEHLVSLDFPSALDEFRARGTSMLRKRAIFCGDLGRKFTPHREEKDVFVISGGPRHGVQVASNGLTSGNDGLMIIRENTESLTSSRLLIFGDSFFRQLLPLLGEVFREVVFCRSRFFHSELVGAIAPDMIYCGQAERYLSRCDSDHERPHFLSYAWARGKHLTPDENFALLWEKVVDERRLVGDIN